MISAIKIVPENWIHYKILALQYGLSHDFWNDAHPTHVDYIVRHPADDFGYVRLEFMSEKHFNEDYIQIDPRAFDDPARYFAVIPRTR